MKSKELPPTIFSFQDYRSFLRAVFEHRARNNSRYSIRAFSKSLELSAGFVSLLLAGKKSLSLTSGLQVCGALKLTNKQAEYFSLLIQKETTTEPLKLGKILEHISSISHNGDVHRLPLDSFHSVAEWYHVALLEMISVQQGKIDLKKVSKSLNIDAPSARAALDRLERLGLIKADESSNTNEMRYVRLQNSLRIESELANDALQHFHKEMLKKAQIALENQSNKEKFIGSETLAIDPAILPEASEILEDAFQKILLLNRQKSKQAKCVYHLGIQFFKLVDG